MVLLFPMLSSSSGSKDFLNYHQPKDAFRAYREELDELDDYVNTLKQQGVLYAKEAEAFAVYLREFIRNKTMHEDLHQVLWPLTKSVKELLILKPFDEHGLPNQEFQNSVNTLEKATMNLSRHRNGRLLIASVFALLTAVTIAAAITISVLIPGAAIFAPILLGLAAAKPAICAGITYSDAYKAHGLLRQANPLLDAMKKELPVMANRR